MVVVGNVGDVKEHLMIDGVDLHAVIFLIAFMFYSQSAIRWRSARPRRWPEGLRSIKIYMR